MQRLVLSIVDGDVGRRAAMTSLLSGGLVQVEPYEHAAELASYWPSEGILLVHDDGCTLDAVMPALAARGRWMPVVAFGEEPTVDGIVAALDRGVLDYFAWPCARGVLLDKLKAVAARSAVIAERRRAVASARARTGQLSERERQVLLDLTHGLSNKEIASRLGISPRTVEIHRSHAITKIGARNSAHAIRIAVQGEFDTAAGG